MNPGDIHWIDFAATGGHEQAGRRPAIVLQDETFLTGATTATRFAATLTITPDVGNNLRKTSVTLVFQIRAVDRDALDAYIGTVTPEQRTALYGLLNRITGQTTA
jgi:mRNA-degrading endonuclease toxin of MazEF toxin-antitoxin module